jgi:hypothetical protein
MAERGGFEPSVPLDLLSFPKDAPGLSLKSKPAHVIITRVVPMRTKRRGFEMRLIIKRNGTSALRADLAQLKAVARAHQWSDDLLSLCNPAFSSDHVTSSASFAMAATLRSGGVLPGLARLPTVGQWLKAHSCANASSQLNSRTCSSANADSRAEWRIFLVAPNLILTDKTSVCDRAGQLLERRAVAQR